MYTVGQKGLFLSVRLLLSVIHNNNAIVIIFFVLTKLLYKSTITLKCDLLVKCYFICTITAIMVTAV